MSKLFVVFGATGQQGGSIVRSVARDPKLSKEYLIRAVTRNVSSPASQELQALGCELAEGDLSDPGSVERVLQGAYAVFIFTASRYDLEGQQSEVEEGKAVADACVAAGAKLIIFSSEVFSEKVGQKVDLFDSKARIEEYIRSLPIKSAHIWPAGFMSNYHRQTKPRLLADSEVYQMANILPSNARLPLIATAEDMGKFVTPVLAAPEKFDGKVIYAASEFLSMEEIAQAITKATGRTVVYEQLPEDVYRGFLSPTSGNLVMDMHTFCRDFGYYGPNGEENVRESHLILTEKLTSFEDFLKAKPIELD